MAGASRLGKVGSGVVSQAWHGIVSRGVEGYGKTWQARSGSDGQGVESSGKSRLDKAR